MLRAAYAFERYALVTNSQGFSAAHRLALAVLQESEVLARNPGCSRGHGARKQRDRFIGGRAIGTVLIIFCSI